MRSIESGTSRFRVWSFGPSRNDGLSDPLEPQVIRDAALALGFAAIAGHGVAVPRPAPVVGALRHPAEIRRAQQMRERPGAIIVDVADKAEFAAALQEPRHRFYCRILHEAPLPVPALRPGIGMDQIDPRQRL